MAAEWQSDVMGTSQVRIHSVNGDVAGAGFLVAADLVCTCAHVVEKALDLPALVGKEPSGSVSLDFPFLSARPSAWANVVSWRHGGADVALLRLERPVEGARAVELVDRTAVWEHPFRVFGYPEGADSGVWVLGSLRARQGTGLLQMEAHLPGPRVTEGFSGSPVWDDTEGGVVGMTVAAHRGESTAYLLPSADLIDEHTVLARCPFQGLEPFTEEKSEFFHGRDADTIRVVEALRQRPVVLVVGPSGCGKSSLIRAGVLPQLRDEDVSASVLRPVASNRAAPVLARALTDVLEPELDEIERLTRAEELARLLTDSKDILTELRVRVMDHSPSAGHVLFVDQLEEYARAAPAEARELFRMLSGLAGRQGPAALRVVATARPDSLDVLVTASTSDIASDAVEFLTPLSDDDLKLAVNAPVDAVPGLWFEPGLPERIVADAGDEPGRMPLVQFALTELWHQRSNSLLTHAAYDALGGIAGALAGHADGVHAQLTKSQRELAPRLFAQLARPGDGDTFIRRPARTADLAPDLLALARQLTQSGKLLVFSHAPGESGQEEILDLAHEALTELWPRLRAWLVESRDFRAWQEQLRADVGRWQVQGNNPARLLSGADLAEADFKLEGHSQDVSAEEHIYIQLSHRNSQRRVRARRAAVGVLAVLTALSVVLAISTWYGLQRAEEQLRSQASGLLAQASEARPPDDPATALQLALAAYNARPTATTRQVLLSQYVRGQHLMASHPSVWKGRATDMTSTPDGRVVVVTSTRSSNNPRFTMVTDALSGTPRARELSGVPKGLVREQALSPDGRFFAATSSPNVVHLWRLGGTLRPKLLSTVHRSAEAVNSTLDFSSDSKRLLLTVKPQSRTCSPLPKCPPAFAEAWETASGARIRVPDGLVPERGVQEAAFTSDPDSVATIGYTSGLSVKRIEIRDLRTSRLRYTADVPTSASGIKLEAGGELLIRRDRKTSYSQALGTTVGTRTELLGNLGSMDSSRHFNVSDFSSADGTDAGLYDEKILTDLSTGQAHIARIPSARNPALSSVGLAVVPRQDGKAVVLAPLGTALMIVRAEPYDRRQFTTTHNDEATSMSPDRGFMAIAGKRSLQVVDSSGTQRQSVQLPANASSWLPFWTADSQWVVVWSRQGNLLAAYPVRNLKDKVSLDGVLPGAKAAAGAKGIQGGEVEDLAALGGGEIALLTIDGRLARFDAADATLLTRLIPAYPDPDRAGAGTLDDIFTQGRLVPRPHHPGTVTAVTRRGAAFGDILLWDLRAPRHIATLSGNAIAASLLASDPSTEPLAFDDRGSLLAVQNSGNDVRVWDVEGRKQLPRGAAGTADRKLIGISDTAQVLTYRNGQVTIQDLADAGSSTTLHVPSGAEAFVRGNHLTVYLGGVEGEFTLRRRSFDLRPEAQFRALCAAAGRDYTSAERKLLPDGTPPGPPCA